MLVEKEIIGPGKYWYKDEATGMPRSLDVTPDLTKYWHEQGSKMLSAGLTIPVPCEHDFTAHPMTPKEKLLNNSGWVKEYRLKNDVLFGVVDIQDEQVAKSLPRTIRWTSPWISSFMDGQGKQWNNVISHLALTTRPRILKQAPFGSIAAALSLATEIKLDSAGQTPLAKDGLCLSRAGRLVVRKRDKKLRPQYPLAFSMYSGGIRLAEEEDMKALKDDGEDMGGDDGSGDEEPDMAGLMNPMQDSVGDVKMEELLCDLLSALGVQMPENVGESEFKRALYEATMSKVKELTGKANAAGDMNAQAAGPNTQSPAGPNTQQNPLIQQESQPMYMSLEDINKLPEPMKSVALAMYTENQKLRSEMDAAKKITDSLRDAKLKEAAVQRTARVTLLGKISPRLKTDLDAMLALPSMALSMGDGGAVVDPMTQTLAMLEKGLSDIPRLLTVDQSALSVQPQPTDESMLSEEATNKMADDMARMMGASPEQKKAS